MEKQTKGAAASTQQEGHALGLFRPILSYFVSILLPSCVRFSLAYSNTHPYFRLLHIKKNNNTDHASEAALSKVNVFDGLSALTQS